ncbi:MAG: hypothetical protein ACNA8W_22185 [Bradymonadaceae bacterium]
MKPAILMTEPRFFALQKGAHPYEPNHSYPSKVLHNEEIWSQWHRYVDAVLDRDIEVYVIDGHPTMATAVFAANAGFIHKRDEDIPSTDKTFYPSHFTDVDRVEEQAYFTSFMRRFGFPIGAYPEGWLFEGSPDLLQVRTPAKNYRLFCYGGRSEREVGHWLAGDVLEGELLLLQHSNEDFLYGQSVMCSLGDHLLVWESGVHPRALGQLREVLAERLVTIPDQDGFHAVPASLYLELEDDQRLLFAPHTMSMTTRDAIESLGVEIVSVDVTSFHAPGIAGPAMLAMPLGPVNPDEASLTDNQRLFRHARHVRALRKNGQFVNH